MGSSLRQGRAAMFSRSGEFGLLLSKSWMIHPESSQPTKQRFHSFKSDNNINRYTSSTSAKTQLLMTTQVQQTNSNRESLIGIDWIKEMVVKVLNDTFDAKEVAKAVALAKLEPNQKKRKNKNKNAVSEEEKEQDRVELSQEEKNTIAEAAAAAAKPFSFDDTMVTPATRLEFGDYQCNAAMGLAKSVGMSPRECANKIVDALRPLIEDVMEEPEIAGPGFINLRFKKDYLEKSIESMAKDSDRLAVPLTR